MFEAKKLDLVNRVCKAFKRNQLPFGGMQVILCGDFFQLPPVPTKGEPLPEFAYKSSCWNETDLKICYLGSNHRHQQDKKFLEILNDIRGNNVGERAVFGIHSRFNAIIENYSVITKLYPKNIEINTINNAELSQLPDLEEKYQMEEKGTSKYYINQLIEGCLAPKTLRLKKNAVVMFVKNNFNRGYVNGTLGKVIGFDSAGFPVVKINSGKIIVATQESWFYERDSKILAEIRQIPLCLAWAITIHKSQGMSLDAAEMDLSNVFEEGMGYVALTRVKLLRGIKLLGINDTAYKINLKVLDFDKTLIEKSNQVRIWLKKMGRKQKIALQKAFITTSLRK